MIKSVARDAWHAGRPAGVGQIAVGPRPNAAASSARFPHSPITTGSSGWPNSRAWPTAGFG